MPRRELAAVPTSAGVGVGERGRGVVVVAELTPAEAAALDGGAVSAVATAAGAPLSHASILVRSLGIPAVTGAGRELLDIPDGVPVLVDGDAGRVVVDPSPGEIDAARARQDDAGRRRDEARRRAVEPASTLDGRRVAVLANAGGLDDARRAVDEGADGIGMLRSEFAFLGRTAPPGEDEQYDTYRAVARVVGERPLVIRTLDLGADVPAWEPAAEANPALGNRGLRLMLGRRELFDTQLRAVARLARDRPLGLMFPMVTTIEELRRAKACLEEAGGETGIAARIDLGMTVEVPAAALTAEVFARAVDFFAVGTNDLTQYTLACDRGNAAVATLADGLHPAVLRLIGEVAAAGRRHGRPVCVVGELAADPVGLTVLLGLGVPAVSVRPNAVAAVKQLVRGVVMDEAAALAEAAQAAESAAAVRDLAARIR